MESYQLIDNEVFEKVSTTGNSFNWVSLAVFKGKSASRNANAFHCLLLMAVDESFKTQPVKNSVRNRQAF
jgi:hypothetical protein